MQEKIIYISIPSVEEVDVEERTDMIDKLLVSDTFTNVLKDVIPKIIGEAITQKKNNVSLFRWYSPEIEGDIDYTINQKDYKKALSKILKFYEEDEDYSQCIEINKLINKL